MKYYIVIVEPERAKTIEGTHCRAYLDETEAKRYKASIPDNKPSLMVVVIQ